jgi:hypothetical protein
MNPTTENGWSEGRLNAPGAHGSLVMTEADVADFPGEGWTEGKLISVADRGSLVLTDESERDRSSTALVKTQSTYETIEKRLDEVIHLLSELGNRDLVDEFARVRGKVAAAKVA